jgi:hypothetical protein
MEPLGKGLPLPRNAFLLRVYHRGIPQDSLDPIIGLTHCDILPCFISSELRKRDPVRRFQREPVLRRKGHAGQDSEQYHNGHNRRDVFTLHL